MDCWNIGIFSHYSIIPPFHQPRKTVWHAAKQALDQADHIEIWGYSLPASDDGGENTFEHSLEWHTGRVHGVPKRSGKCEDPLAVSEPAFPRGQQLKHGVDGRTACRQAAERVQFARWRPRPSAPQRMNEVPLELARAGAACACERLLQGAQAPSKESRHPCRVPASATHDLPLIMTVT